MKFKDIPIEEPKKKRDAISYKIGDSATEHQYKNTIELRSGMSTPTALSFAYFAGYCKQWFKAILGLTTTDSPRTAPIHTMPVGNGKMKITKEEVSEKSVHYTYPGNKIVGANNDIQFNQIFPLKFTDDYSEGASLLRERNQRLRNGLSPLPDNGRVRTFEPRKFKSGNSAVSEKSEAEVLRSETEQLARMCSWGYTVATQQFICTDYVHTLLRIPAGKTISSFSALLGYFAEEDRAKMSQCWSQALSSGKALNCVTRLGHVQGNTWIKFMIKPVYKDARLIKVVGTLQDVTDSIETELRLTDERETAEQATKVKSEFVSLMSHEIRTPLNAIMGLTYLLLQEENIAHQHKENLQSIHFSSQNMLSLINNTLDFSRIEAGKIEIEKVNFQLKDLLKKIHRSLSIRASEKQLAFNLHVDEDIPFEVAGDPARLTQVLNNLLSNAIKFTNSGSVTLAVEVVYQSSDDWVLEFKVSDTGVGIPEHRQQQIFESFVQASVATHREYGGTGLGLAITKKIVELQNGIIQLKSEPGLGSEFIVRLRFLKPNPSFESLKATEQLNSAFSNLKDAKVLVIDDNAINNLVASKLLISWQAVVETAGDGRAALEKIKAGAYDLVLMDLHMPVMNGFDAIAEIRNLGYTMPIIALTANASEDEKKKTLALGGNDYLTKPFVPQELHDKIQEYLQPAFL